MLAQVFTQRYGFIISIYRRTGCDYHPFNASLPACLEKVFGATDVHIETLAWLFHRFRDGYKSRFMENDIHTFYRFSRQLPCPGYRLEPIQFCSRNHSSFLISG